MAGSLKKGDKMPKKFLGIVLSMLVLAAVLMFHSSPAVMAGGEDLGKGIAQILKNQEKILQELQEIKKELDVIRVRVH